MKKITAISSITAMALVLSLTTINTNQTKRSDRKNVLNLSRMSVGFNKVVAAPGIDHQDVYDQAKNEVNMEVAEVVKSLNALLTAAKISSCENIPAVSATAFHTSNDGDLYSSAVGGKTFPISTVTGVTFTKKVELKMAGTATTVGAVYADCNSGAVEVRYLGKGVINGDSNLIIAYHESDAGLESIVMFSDYPSDGSYTAAKIAVHYIEGASSQSVTYAYAENGTDGLAGTMVANTSGTVTSGNVVDTATGAAKEDLQRLVPSLTGGFSIATIDAATAAL